MYNLSDLEIEKIVKLLKEGKSLPEDYKNILFDIKNEIELMYPNKEKGEDILNNTIPIQLQKTKVFKGNEDDSNSNYLIFGDNLNILKTLLNLKQEGKLKNSDGTLGIKLIYIDPPFATNRIFKNKKNQEIYSDKKKGAEFVEFIKKRLVLMRELLADDGSIYVHLDWHFGHYVKVMMDEIFGYGGKGKQGFRNEILWAYRTGGAPGKDPGFSKKHDVILFYSKSDKSKFNKFKERIYYEKAFFTPQKDESGRYYADVILRDVLEDEINLVVDNELLKISVKPVINVSAERLDFDTQKPEGLLQILIMATTGPGDIVADFFCGSGTTLSVAEKLGRRWIGSDIGEIAINITLKRILNISESKDLKDTKRKYNKQYKTFVLYNIDSEKITYSLSSLF